MSNIELHLKTYDELQFEVMTLTTNSYLKDLKIKELQERIDKAIEYIKYKTTDEETGEDLGYSDNINYEELLNILKGEENE